METQRFMWFGFWPTSTGGIKEKVSLTKGRDYKSSTQKYSHKTQTPNTPKRALNHQKHMTLKTKHGLELLNNMQLRFLTNFINCRITNIRIQSISQLGYINESISQSRQNIVLLVIGLGQLL